MSAPPPRHVAVPRNVAVIDIGKTNAKLALVDLDTLAEIAVLTTPNCVLPGPPYPHFDTEGLWAFVLASLGTLHRAHGIGAISATTHGAAAALLGPDGGLAAPVLDYEHDGPDELAAEYDALRPDFALTGSPRLPGGLNLGAQIFWQMRVLPGLAQRTAALLPWPQYWAHRLTGVAAAEVTSLGCHTDLWLPWQGRVSPLPGALGLAGRLAPLRAASDVLGPVLPQVAAATGLDPMTPVVCGLHDSNASLYPHLLRRRGAFAVVSTGTWVVCMAMGARRMSLDPARDLLVNVNALGAPVPSARFMGGREHDVVLGANPPDAGPLDMAEVLAQGLMLLPAVVPTCGPFAGQRAEWTGPEPLPGSGARSAAVAFCLALTTATCLDLIGAAGPVVVEGPFARNAAYLDMLQAATGRVVEASGSATGTSIGAALLVAGSVAPAPTPHARSPLPGMAAYAREWQRRAGRQVFPVLPALP